MVAPLISRTTGLLAPLASKAVSRVGTAIRATGEVQEQEIETLTGQDEKLKDRIPVEFESAEDIRQDIQFLTDPNLPDQQTIYDNISKEELDLFKEQRKEGAEFGFKRFDKYVTPDKNAQEVENLNRQNAQDYHDNKISFDELKKRNAELMPLKFRELIDDKGNVNIPKAATEEEVLKALGVSGKQSKIIQAKEGKDGIVGLTKTPALKEHIEQGGRVGARLDIPAYEKAGTYVATLHDKEQGGKTLAYASTSVLKNVEFSVSPKAALKIARKKDYSPKSTIARMYGEYVPHKATDAEAYARQAIAKNPKDWIQIGMNPDRASYFYDKADGMPVVSADEVIQIGEFILVKGAKKTKPNDSKFRINPKDPNDLRTYQEGGDVKDQTQKMLKKKKGIKDITTEDLEPTSMVIKETGRPVFKSPAGMHSEIGVTLEMGGKFVNIPSIQDGKVLTGDELADGIKSGKLKPTGVYDEEKEAHQASRDRSDSLTSERIDGLDKPAMQEGGLLQEGGTVDPVSGNDVPVGSTQEEVRDDIPAQLSEGEFVFPADVVRFIGLDNLMKLRQEAKSGLAKMDRMGQMGNSEEAVEDDTGEFDTDIDDIIGEIEREARMAKPEEEEQTEEEPPIKKSGEERLGFNTGGLGTKEDSSEKEKEVGKNMVATDKDGNPFKKATKEEQDKTTLTQSYTPPKKEQPKLLDPLNKEQMDKAFAGSSVFKGIVEKELGAGTTYESIVQKNYPNLMQKSKQEKAGTISNSDTTSPESNLYNQIVNQNEAIVSQNKDMRYTGKQSDKKFIFKRMAKDLSNAGIKDLKQLGYKDIEQPKVKSELIKKGDKYYIKPKSVSSHLTPAKKSKLIEVSPEDVKTIEVQPLGLGIKETKIVGLIPQAPKRVLINKDTGEQVVQGKYGGDLNQQQDTTQPLGYGARTKAKQNTDLELWEMANDPRRGLRWGNTTSVEGMANYMISFDEKGQAVVFPQYVDTTNEGLRDFAYAVAAGAAITYGPAFFGKAGSKISSAASKIGSSVAKKITKKAITKKVKEKIIKTGVKAIAKKVVASKDE